MSFEARSYGECAACGEDIQPGDEVLYDDDSELIHVECDDDMSDLNYSWKVIPGE